MLAHIYIEEYKLYTIQTSGKILMRRGEIITTPPVIFVDI